MLDRQLLLESRVQKAIAASSTATAAAVCNTKGKGKRGAKPDANSAANDSEGTSGKRTRGGDRR